MARLRSKLFYECNEQISSLSGQDWAVAYDSNCKKVVDYLVQKGVGNTIYYSTIRCLENLRTFLLQNSTSYSPEEANRWFQKTEPHPKGYQSALLRLQDMYEYNGIQPENSFPVSFPYYSHLLGLWKKEADDYFASLNHTICTIEQIKNCTARFLYRLQASGISHPSELTFASIELYLETDGHKSQSSKARYTYAISDILIFMASRGLCSQGIGWYPYFRMHGKTTAMRELPESTTSQLESLRLKSLEFSSGEFADLIPDFLERFYSAGYSKSPRAMARYTLYKRLLFLEMHDLGYHPLIATVWLEHEKHSYKQDAWIQLRRIIDLFELYIREGEVLPQVVFWKKALLHEALPGWCRDELVAFMIQKSREGWEESTLCMYRSSVTRFCQFLADSGLDSFTQIDPELIKEFNRTDPHMTVGGKNAYNVKIRKFIRYLERKGLLPYGIYLALGSKVATTEKIVIILSKEEKTELSGKLELAATQKELRNRAILLLGLKMGLRASDIVTMKLLDINWNDPSIRILQKKTRHEIDLPMPTDVGNAIYLYIKNGRPQTDCPFVFVKTRTPFDSLGREVCLRALKSTLPERDCPGSGFHVTRKTFATDRLRHSTPKRAIADMLGHRSTDSLSPYLNLDSDRMCLCPLSLSETNLTIGGGRYD